MASHLISLTFDDGFAKSGADLAVIFESFGLRTSLNIIARGADPEFASPDEWHNAPRGSWELWNRLAGRGHEINPHGLDHSNPNGLPAGEASRRVDQCIEIFRKNLAGFDPLKSVFACPYNALTPELEEKLGKCFRAYRPGGNPVNALPSAGTKRVNCWSDGPGNADASTEAQVRGFLDSPGGWLVLGMHGLDKEGWGPLSTGYLKGLLERLMRDKRTEVIGVAEALEKYGKVGRGN